MRIKNRKTFILLSGAVAAVSLAMADDAPAREYGVEAPKDVTVVVDGASYSYRDMRSGTVSGVLDEGHIALSAEDRVFPSPEEPVFSGSTIFVERSKDVSVVADGGRNRLVTYARTVEEALAEGGIALREDDIVVPDRTAHLNAESEVRVTRVEVHEETVEKRIAYDTVENEDDELSWRKRIVTQKGEEGIRTYRYKVSYHDGKEVARKPLGSEVTREPVKEIVTQGTYVKTGKSHSGAASWYAWTGTMAAANPWLPMGSYVKVTNRANGKSVIVKINDRGPFVPGRIIDLDRVAFEQIASVGAGVIDVKMEEIVN